CAVGDTAFPGTLQRRLANSKEVWTGGNRCPVNGAASAFEIGKLALQRFDAIGHETRLGSPALAFIDVSADLHPLPFVTSRAAKAERDIQHRVRNYIRLVPELGA